MEDSLTQVKIAHGSASVWTGSTTQAIQTLHLPMRWARSTNSSFINRLSLESSVHRL